MKRNLNFLLIPVYIFTVLIFFTIQNNGFAQDKSEIFYQCAPCGCASDEKQFEYPGNCPSCGMTLEERKEPNPILQFLNEPMNVAILLYTHVQPLDYAGPYDVFISGGEENFNVYTVGETSEPIITMPNLSINPQYTISNCPKPDILIIPGGMWRSVNQKVMDWINESSKDADYVFSICTGAFILAEAGFLDGLEATTHSAGVDLLEKNYPNIKKVHRNKRFVDNGKVITSAGVSAGIDASLYLISKILGKDRAQAAANNLEYIYWEPER